MSRKMNQNEFAERCAQLPLIESNAYRNRRNGNKMNKNLPRPESFVCCPDLQTAQLDDCDSGYRVININLKECATKLWNNLFGNFSIESASYFDNDSKRNFSANNVCNVPGCNYTGGEMMSKKAMMRSRSETSKYDYQKPIRRNVDVAKANRMKAALKCCIQEKIARSKICDSFLTELQQVLARYPYTDLYYYWELLRAIQAEVEEHKCNKLSSDERGDKKLKQLYMLSYAITRLILQLDFIAGGNPMYRCKRSKSWGQVLNQFKEDFWDPATGQFSMNPFPRIASSLKSSFQDDANQQNLCSCLPLGFVSRAIGIVGSEGENNCLTLKVDCFPDDFTCFDLESLTYLLDNLNSDLRLECNKGTTGRCQVTNCPYPVPVRDEKVVKELGSNIRAIEQLIFYLQRMNCFTVKVSPMRNCDKVCKEDKPNTSRVQSKGILKNRCNPVDNQMNVEIATYQVQCPPSPKQNFRRTSCCSPVREKNNIQNCTENQEDCGFTRNNSPNLRVTKVSRPKTNNNMVVDLCCAEPPKIRNSSSRRRTPERTSRRARSGASRSPGSCTQGDVCKKCNKVNPPCTQCKEKKEDRRKPRRDSNSDRECDFSFRVKGGEEKYEEKEKNLKACETKNTTAALKSNCKLKVDDNVLMMCCDVEKNLACGTKNTATELKSNCKPKDDNNVLIMCCNVNCESKSGVISSLTKLVKKIDPKVPPPMCDPCNKIADNYKAQKCVEKLRKSSKSNVQINDCKHKKEQIIRLVNLLSNNDCSFKPTNRSSALNNTCKNGLEEVCELYDKFLALEVDEDIGKKKGSQQDEPSCVEKLKIAFANINRGKSAQNTTNHPVSNVNVKRKASIGVQASTCSKQSCSVGPPSKHSIGTSALFNPNADSNWAQPSKTKTNLNIPKPADSSSVLSKRLSRASSPSTPSSRSKENLKRNSSEIVINLRMNPGKVGKIGNAKSIECLRKKLESRYKALSKQQQKVHEKQRKAAEKKRLKEQRAQNKVKCFKCRVCRSGKSSFNLNDPKSKNRMRCCKQRNNCEASKSKSSLKSGKSENNVTDTKSACSIRGCKSKSCKMKECKKSKSCSAEVFASKKDPCFSLDMPDNIRNVYERKEKCSSSKCKGKKKKSRSLIRKAKFKKSNPKLEKSQLKLKECDSNLKKTRSKLKKSCSELQKYNSKLKKYEFQIKKCQSRLSQCDEAKKKLEKCTSVLLKKLSQHEANNN